MNSKCIKHIFQKYPLISNCFTYGCMCVGAEFSQQLINKRVLRPQTPPEMIDVDILKRYSIIGFCINPNILYFWYKWLDKKYAGVTVQAVFKKLYMDQFLMTPILYVIFYTSMSIMEKKEDIFEELRIKFIPTFQTSCLFWLPVQAVNFFLIPNTFRVLYVGVCSFAWINILCYLKRKEV